LTAFEFDEFRAVAGQPNPCRRIHPGIAPGHSLKFPKTMAGLRNIWESSGFSAIKPLPSVPNPLTKPFGA